jgi:hypothetical protein
VNEVEQWRSRRPPYVRAGTITATIVLLMMLTPSVPSSPVSSSSTLSAPYAGTSWFHGKAINAQCASASAVRSAKWNATTGGLTAWERAQSHGCNSSYPPGSPVIGNAEGFANVAIPTGTLSGNNVNVSVNFTFTETSLGGVTGTPSCSLGTVHNGSSYAVSRCILEVYYFVAVSAHLYDATNRTYVSQDSAEWQMTNYTNWYNYSIYSSGSWSSTSYYSNCTAFTTQYSYTDFVQECAGVGTTRTSAGLWLNNSSPGFNDTLNSSHAYYVILSFAVMDSVYWDSQFANTSGAGISGIASAGWTTNVATLRNGGKITSITIH